MQSQYNAAVQSRFWAKIKRSPDGCWHWTGARNRRGYGAFRANDGQRRLTVLAHRFAWELTNGPIPVGMNVLHRCDNPPCVNPDHLFLGTHADNVADCMAKGRNALGEQQHKSHLTNAMVLAIRAAAATGESHRSISLRFEVHMTTVANIVHRRMWKHI